MDIYALLDLRGLTLHAYHSGKDDETADQAVRTPNHTLDKFVNQYLLPITQTVPLNHIIAVHDAGNYYRQTLNPEYKANRKAKPVEPAVAAAMEDSKNAIRNLLHSLGIPQVSVPMTEADDVIAYLATRLPGQKLIYTVDADLIALANDNVQVFLKGEPHQAMRKGGITILPRHVTLFKSIVGDPSDNIKGVKGLGPSAWQTLEADFGLDGLDQLITLVEDEDVYKIVHLAQELQHKVISKLADNVGEWMQSYKLAKLKPELVDAKQGKDFTRLKWEKRLPSADRLDRLMAVTGAKWLKEDIEHLLPQQFLITRKDWDENTLEEARQLFAQSRYISIDWETWNPHQEYFKQADEKYVDMYGQRIAGAGVTCGQNLEYTFYFQFEHADEWNNIDKKHLVELLEVIPEGMPLVIQNALFEATVFMKEFGYGLPDMHDTKIMASHVDETMPSGLKDMSKQWLNYDQIRYDSVIEKGKTMKDYTGSHVFKYGSDDPLVTAHLYDLFKLILLVEGSWDFVRDHEFMMPYILSDAYLAGVSVDFEEVERQRAEDQQTIDENIAKIRSLLEAHVNEETIYKGASNWVQELVLNHVAEGRFVIAEAEKRAKDSHFAEWANQDKAVKTWAGSILDEEVTFEDVKAEIERKLKLAETIDPAHSGERAKLWLEAVEAATYKPYQETVKPAKFFFKQGHVNQIAEKFGILPAPPIDNLAAWQALPETSFTKAVCECIETKPKHSKTQGYKELAKFYTVNFDGGVEKSGTELNFDSPKQMTEFLYAMLGLPIRVRALEPSDSRVEKGLDGVPQTNEDAVRDALANGDALGWRKEVLELMMAAKKAKTRIKFFYSKFPLWKHPEDGLIHPSFNSTGTETRRPTGSAPNMLQLSKKGDGVKVRRCFIPNQKLGHDLVVSIDWDSQELRIIAGLSGDHALTSCYVGERKKNVHSLTAAGIAGLSYEEFTKIYKDEDHELNKSFDDLRKNAKSVNFLSTYGGGAGKLARKLLCPVDTAAEYLKAKKATYSGIEDWREREITKLHAQGYLTTLYGSRKHVFNRLNHKDEGMIRYLERASINFEIQGVAADYLKKVLADIYRDGVLHDCRAVLIAAIYDELVFSVHSSQAVQLIKRVYRIMAQGMPGLPIPMLSNPALGVNFADQVEILKDADDTLTDDKILAAIDKAFGVERRGAA